MLPHRIDHVSNMRAMAEAGCDRVLGLGSVGGLRPDLGAGTMLVPDDFIALDVAPVTGLEGEHAHTAAAFDREWRQRVLAALAAAGANARDGGVYWQASGPRFETPAEVRLIASHADVVGMTLGSECVAACELGIAYAAICVVDNLANGVQGADISLEGIGENRRRNRERLQQTLAAILPELAS